MSFSQEPIPGPSRTKEGYLWTKEGIIEGLETKAVQANSKSIEEHYDVIVVGTGFAGLIAARDLAKRPKTKVLLIEARDRIGGRTWTARALGEEFEMGGTWVHWFQPHVYGEIHRYGLHRHLKTSAGTSVPEKTYYKPSSGPVAEVPTVETNDIIERVGVEFFHIDNLDSRRLMPFPHEPFREPALWKQYDHLTVKDRLNQMDISQHDKDIFESIVNSLGSAPGTDIGFVELLRWYALSGHSMAQVFELAGVYKLGKGGMTSFAKTIADEFKGDILFNTPVRKFKQSQDFVTIETRSGARFEAKAVVSTIPLNCLSEIVFDPPLSPLRQKAVVQGHINKGAKVHIRVKQTQPAWFATCNAYSTPPSPWCFGFADHNGTETKGGTWCIAFGYNSHLEDPRASKEIIKSFGEHLCPDVEAEAYLTHDWMNDPFSKGTWSCWGPGSMSEYLQELQKPHGRIVFASADWADGWRGFVDGAIESGSRAVGIVKQLLDERTI